MKGLAPFACALLVAVSLATSARADCPLCTCTVLATPMAFGVYSPLGGAHLDAVAGIDVACAGPVALASFTIAMDDGQNGAFALRKMANGASRLDYNIYANAARTQIWGDGTGGYGTVTVSNGAGLVIWNSSTSAYGRIHATPAAAPGVYTDIVVVTIEW